VATVDIPSRTNPFETMPVAITTWKEPG